MNAINNHANVSLRLLLLRNQWASTYALNSCGSYH